MFEVISDGGLNFKASPYRGEMGVFGGRMIHLKSPKNELSLRGFMTRFSARGLWRDFG